MAEPEIRYCASADGTQIAYADVQAIRLPPAVVVDHSLLPMATRTTTPSIVGGRRYVRFDRRGIGYSQRDVSRIDFKAQIEDMSAVIESAGLEHFNLLGLGDGCGVAATYAAHHPEHVSRMLLRMPWWETSEQMQGLVALIRSNWNLGRRALVDASMGDLPAEERVRLIGLTRRIVAPEVAALYVELACAWQSTAELKSIRCPAMIFVQPAGEERMGRVRALVSQIPGAGLKVIQDATGRDERTFLYGEEAEGAYEAPASERRGLPSLVTILFADIVDSTALSEQLGNATFRERSLALERRVRAQIQAHAGLPVAGRTLGDGVLATFQSASDAIAAAVACASAGSDLDLALHLGLHAGDVIREEGNVSGQAVSIASRVSGLSGPNEVLVSATVRDLARASSSVSFEDRGEQTLKGVTEPMRLYEVR